MLLLFYGDNSYAAKQKIAEVTDKYLAKNNDFGLERIDGATLQTDKLEGLIQATPFLASSRLVIIDNLTKNKDFDADKVEKIFSNIPETTIVVVYEPSADKRTAVFKRLKKLAKPAEFAKLEGSKLINWVRKKAQDLELKLDQSDAKYIVDRVGEDQWTLHHEIDKLANYGDKIDRKAIDMLIEPSLTQTIFELTDSLTSSSPKTALDIYRDLRRKRLEPMYIMSMLGWHLTNLIIVKSAEGRPINTVAKQAKMSPFVARKSSATARKLELGMLKEANDLLINCDEKLKTQSVDADHVIEATIYKINKALNP